MEYGQRYNDNQTPKDIQQVIGEFEFRVSDRINELDQTVRDLLQIVSTLTIPTISRISPCTGVCLGIDERDQNFEQTRTECHASDVCQHILFTISLLCSKCLFLYSL